MIEMLAWGLYLVVGVILMGAHDPVEVGVCIGVLAALAALALAVLMKSLRRP